MNNIKLVETNINRVWTDSKMYYTENDNALQLLK